MPTASLKPLPPKEAIAYLKAKGFDLPKTFDWRDMWQEAHATAFTVAKSAGFDILKDIHAAVVQAKGKGLSFEEFSRQLTPILQAKGWWGKKEVVDPATGEVVTAQLGSPRRLSIIYDTNMRMAYSAGEWAKIQRVKHRMPYLVYVTKGDARVRPQHAAWNGTVLPVDHEWWKTHFPPNGWCCRCGHRQYSQRDLDAFGLKVSEDPKEELVPWTNDRTGETYHVPKGIDPGFAYNPGEAALDGNAARALMGKLVDATPDLAAAQAASARFVVPALARELGDWIKGVARSVEGGEPMTTGERRVVGALDDQVIAYLRDKGYEPDSGAITLSDKDVTHMYREAKRERGDTLSIEELSRLPSVLANPKAVLWDKENPGLLYVFERDGGAGKVVVQVDYAVRVRNAEGKRQTIRTNNVRSARVVGRTSTFENQSAYTVVKGEL